MDDDVKQQRIEEFLAELPEPVGYRRRVTDRALMQLFGELFPNGAEDVMACGEGAYSQPGPARPVWRCSREHRHTGPHAAYGLNPELPAALWEIGSALLEIDSAGLWFVLRGGLI